MISQTNQSLITKVFLLGCLLEHILLRRQEQQAVGGKSAMWELEQQHLAVGVVLQVLDVLLLEQEIQFL